MHVSLTYNTTTLQFLLQSAFDSSVETKLQFRSVQTMDRSAEFKSIHQRPMLLPIPHNSTAARDVSFSDLLKPQLNNRVDNSEISIFDAQKYFYDTTDVINLESVLTLSTASSNDSYARNYKAHPFHATPTASSEASWNSRSGLLSNPPAAVTVSIRNPSIGHDKKKNSATKWLLSRKCPCSDKKSIQVEDKQYECRAPTSHPNMERRICVEKRFVATDWLERQDTVPNSRRISADNNRFPLASSMRPISINGKGFTFPILNQTPSPIKKTLNGHKTPPLEDPARDSLEVFRPPEDVAPSKTTVESFTIPTSPTSRMTAMDDDIVSDASSDLFEIESFSNQTPYHMHNTNRRGPMDETSPNSNERNLYAPSEASIDWSVTTAEAFERGSLANFSVTASEVDQDFKQTGLNDALKKNCGKRRGTSGGGGGGGGLLGCHHEKAVSVGPQPVKSRVTQGRRVGENSTIRHVSSRPPKPQLARSYSAQLPKLEG